MNYKYCKSRLITKRLQNKIPYIKYDQSIINRHQYLTPQIPINLPYKLKTPKTYNKSNI